MKEVSLSSRKRNIASIYIVLATVFCTISCGSYEDKPSVILIIIDTLRADHLSCYGYERITSPVLDSLAATGTIWANANSNASWTLPATASIWTGVAPKSHGVTMSLATGNVFGISPETPVLPMVMKSNGYQTAGFFNVYLLGPYFGFHKGFDRYDYAEKGHGRAEETVDMAIQWLEEIDHEKPFFLTVHLFDVHAPYDPPAPFNTLFCNDETDGKTYWDISENGDILHPEQLEHLMGLYDGEIALVDSELGRLFRTVRDLELDQKTLIIVTADHGEEFLEHGYVEHGKNLFQETVHIPLITSGAQVAAGAVRHETVAQFDIFPSILSYCACLTDNRFEGVSFFSESLPENRFIPASEINTGVSFNLASVTDGKIKVIWDADTDSSEMYDLISDPMELNPMPADSELLSKVLLYWASPCLWNPVLLENWRVAPVLRDLGYI